MSWYWWPILYVAVGVLLDCGERMHGSFKHICWPLFFLAVVAWPFILWDALVHDK